MLMPLAAVSRQRGFSLLEALVAILIFSIGILGLIALQAQAISLSTDAKNRADAAFLANQLIGQLSVADPGNLANFAHRPNGSGCTPPNPSGANSTDATVLAWLAQVGAVLPGFDAATTAASKQQIKVDTANNLVSITLCWRPTPSTSTWHQHTVTTQLQWQ
jgi:type IV pilus assembly protein PilV